MLIQEIYYTIKKLYQRQYIYEEEYTNDKWKLGFNWWKQLKH